MNLNQSDETIIAELEQWTEKLNQSTVETSEKIETYVSQFIHKIPVHSKEAIFEKLDTWIHYFQTFVQEWNSQTLSEETLIKQAQQLHPSVTSLEDVRQLSVSQQSYLSNKVIARHRIYASIQGSVVGSGNTFAEFTDILALLFINLRSIQLTAMSFGYSCSTQTEKIIALKIYCAAILPPSLKAQEWDRLLEEADSLQYVSHEMKPLLDEHHVTHFVKSAGKLLLIHAFTKKKQSFPMLSSILTAGYHYTYVKKVTEFAQRYYQFRSLKDKEQQR